MTDSDARPLDVTDARLAATLEQMVQEYVKVIGEMQAALAQFRDRAESLEHSLIEQTLECSRLRDSLNAREAELDRIAAALGAKRDVVQLDRLVEDGCVLWSKMSYAQNVAIEALNELGVEKGGSLALRIRKLAALPSRAAASLTEPSE